MVYGLQVIILSLTGIPFSFHAFRWINHCKMCIVSKICMLFMFIYIIIISIRTNGDISVLCSITFLWGSEVLNPLQSCPECTRVSDTSACPRLWLGHVGVLCQKLEARKNSVENTSEEADDEKLKQGNSDYDHSPCHELQVVFGNIVVLSILK